MKEIKWLEDAVFYEIYPQSYYDSNGDGIGDLNGIIEKLDYIQEIGCNAIWLNPCFDSPFKDAGYDVRDYKKIAPRYGTNEDMKDLIDEMHKRKMHLILDLVPCHTSEEHSWFISSTKQEKNEYSQRYIWTDGAFNKPNNLTAVGGEYERNGTYVISFFNCQPSLNYGFKNITEKWQCTIDSKDALNTQNAMIDVMKFWLSMGIDGFRVDMAACLVKNDDAEIGTQEAWKRMFGEVRKDFPEAVFVSEWSNPTRSLKCGFNMDFYLDHGWNGGNGYHHLLRDNDIDLNTYSLTRDDSYFKFNSNQTIEKFLKEYQRDYKETKNDGYISFITDNHDMIRLKKFFTEEEIKVIFGFIFTMPGVPFLYYGDEIGMEYLELPTKEGGYHRTGSRTPMQWSNAKNLGFSTADKDKLYLPVDCSSSAPTVQKSLEDKESLLYYVKDLISLRHMYKDLQSLNNFKLYVASKKSKLFAYLRGDFLMVLYPSSQRTNLKLDANYQVVRGVGEYRLEGKKLVNLKNAFLILKK